jgi:membrane-associated phospholipid phosphatase
MNESSSLVELAQRVGPHALTAFLVLLVTATATGGALHATLRHRRQRADAQSEPRPERLLGGLAVGFGGIVMAALLFAWIAWQIAPGRSLGLADQALADAIGAHLPRAALRFFGHFTHVGDPSVLIVLAAVVAVMLWRARRPVLMWGWLLALAGNAVLNPSLKQIFERVRPVHDHGFALATGFSFPSGHSSGALVTYGMLAVLGLRLLPPRWHTLVVMAAIAMVLTTACSRIFLQVHFASDVAAGLLSGAAWLTVCVITLGHAERRRARRSAAPGA